MLKISTEPAHQQMFTIMFNLESMEGEAAVMREHMHLQSMNFFRDLEITPNAVHRGQLPEGWICAAPPPLLHCTWTATSSTGCTPDRIDLIEESDFLLDTLFTLIASPTLRRHPESADAPPRQCSTAGGKPAWSNAPTTMSPTPLPHAPRRRTTPPLAPPSWQAPMPPSWPCWAAAVICWRPVAGQEDLRLFRQQGLTVTAFDASRAQAACCSRLCGQPVRVCRVEQMQSVVPYDGIWASGSSLSARTRIAPALGHLATLLKAGGPPPPPFPHGKGRTTATVGEYPLQTRLDEAGLRRPDRSPPLHPAPAGWGR